MALSLRDSSTWYVFRPVQTHPYEGGSYGVSSNTFIVPWMLSIVRGWLFHDLYQEERDCIGCTHCATTARGTFFMEEDHGRARVYHQSGDSERVVEEAVCSSALDFRQPIITSLLLTS